MVKILIGFILFAALALFILMKSGGNVNLGDEHAAGEKSEQHGTVAPAADKPADKPKSDTANSVTPTPATAQTK